MEYTENKETKIPPKETFSGYICFILTPNLGNSEAWKCIKDPDKPFSKQIHLIFVNKALLKFIGLLFFVISP